MTVPQPKVALNNACSVIFNNTLYTYSADAFQSLRLERGAEWEELPQGEKVTGGVCVGSTTGTAATSAFFVVGGTGGSAGYQGLQKYTYAAGQWETVKLASAVTDQRLGHNAVYLNSTDSILVYGGTQDGSHAASSQTFTIGASAPYSVTSYDAVAPAALNPILLPWSTSEAVMVGGSTTNTKVMLFSQARNWTDSGASLATPLTKDTSSMQAVLMTGDDGSKNLITFDMSVSPNVVKRTVLFSAPTVPVPNAAPVRRRTLSRKNLDSKETRSTAPLNVYDWPAYNSTLAPKATRKNFALAQGADGTVVIAGGNEDDVLCMFDCRQNSWEDTGSKLAQFKVLSTDSSTSSSASATSTASSSTLSSSSTSLSSSATSSTSATPSVTDAAAATQTATGTAVPTVSDGSGPPLNTILGAVLGGVFGLAIALVLAYFCIRRQRRRRAHLEAGHLRRASGMSSNEKGGIGFASNSLSLGQGPPGVFRGHQQQGSENSFTGLLMGRNGQKSAPSALSRKSSNDSRRDSGDSTFRAFKSTISKPFPQPSQPAAGFRPPQPQLQPIARDEKAGVAFTADTAESKPRNITAGPDRRGSTRRSSGWNRYWSGGSALNLLGFGSGNGSNNAAAANNANNNNTSRRTTLRSEGSSAYSDPHRMTQDSATVPPLFPAAAAADAPRMSFSRVHSASPTIAVYSGGDKFLKEGLSGRIESSSSRPRPVSALSDESASAYSSGIPESVADAWDPTAANRPWGADRALNTSFTGLYSTALTPASAAQGGRGQQQTQQQGRVGSSQAQAQQAPVRDDMSWLNLGSAR